MKMLSEDIKNRSFKTSYLLCGDEAYLRTQYRNRLMNALADPQDTMNVSRFEGKNIRPEEIIDLAETLPFFADRRVAQRQFTSFFHQGLYPSFHGGFAVYGRFSGFTLRPALASRACQGQS